MLCGFELGAKQALGRSRFLEHWRRDFRVRFRTKSSDLGYSNRYLNNRCTKGAELNRTDEVLVTIPLILVENIAECGEPKGDSLRTSVK